MSLSIAIMQPTYLSWAGYFSLISAVDVFVFLDSVQFEHRSWQQRNRIKTQNGSLWLTVPVLKRGLRNQNINEVQIDQNSRYQKKHLNSIHQNYTHSNHYEEMYELIKDIIENFMPNLLVNSLSITPADPQEEVDIATGQNTVGSSESSIYRFPGKGTSEYTAKIRIDYSTNGSTFGQSDFVIINI
jgi:hypothetical protein